MSAEAPSGNGVLNKGQVRLYDRQIGALGMETMSKLIQARVLIVGMRAVGVEIAKNVILAGPKAVTLADSGTVETADLSANYYLSPGDVGSNRADVVYEKLHELNPYVAVSVHSGPISTEVVDAFDVVVMTSSTPEEKIRVNEYCHSAGIVFIACEIHGVFGYLFNDFGPSFTVTDTNDDKARVAWLSSIENSNPAVVHLHDDFGYAFEDGDYVTLAEVQGMPEINGLPPARVTRTGKYTFELEGVDSTNFGAYSVGGIASQVKQPATITHRTLAECIESPGELPLYDYGKFTRPSELHTAFVGLHNFQSAHGGILPEGLDTAHEDEVAAAAAAYAEAHEGAEYDEKIARMLASQSRAELSPMASVFGGIVAQEVIKATGKYMPFSQYFYFDSVDSMAADPVPAEDRAPRGTRYDGQASVFGHEFQEKLGALNYFLVGSGALGCEFLKGFAMMGVGCGEGGSVTVTDMDNIETSNLNRQFLFRNNHVNMPKSVVAADAAKAMNNDLNVIALTDRVAPDTENIFTAEFWAGLSGVTNALDNVVARRYVDSKCVEFKKSLLESGTQGTKANVQVILPDQTESYSSSNDPPEVGIPQCTLHNFPYLIEHCIALSREQFDSYFTKAALDAKEFLTRGDEFLSSLRNLHDQRVTLEAVSELLAVAKAGPTMKACVEWARLTWESKYNHSIRQMLFLLPPDKIDSHGNPFWSGTKRLPHPLEFNADDETHMSFIIAAANIRAYIFGLPPLDPENADDVARARELVDAVEVPEFVESTTAKIQTEENEEIDQSLDDDDVVVARLKGEVPRDVPADAINTVTFEKDEDSNSHIDFIAAASNLRARVYDITEKTRLDIKLIAGNIIPALATTTAMTTGLVLLEMYKLVNGREMEAFRNSFLNLAVPFITMSEPIAAPKFTSPGPAGENYYPDGFTIWDRWTIADGDITLQHVMDWLKKTHKLDVSMVSMGESLVYMGFMPAHKERPAMKVTDLYKKFQKVDEIPSTLNEILLTIGCEDEEGRDLEIPPVYVRFR